MKCLRWITAALAAPLFLAGPAMADFTFSTLTTPASQAFGAASVAQFGATSSLSTLNGSQGIVLVTIGDQTTAPATATDTGAVNAMDVVTITQTAGHGSTGAGSGTITLSATLNWTRSDIGGQSSFFSNGSVGAPLTIGNTTYSLIGFIYTQPTVNVPLGAPGSGKVSAILTVTVVPEPSSMAAMGVGGLLLAAPRLRRLVRRIAKS
jgi:hypothetical protein